MATKKVTITKKTIAEQRKKTKERQRAYMENKAKENLKKYSFWLDDQTANIIKEAQQRLQLPNQTQALIELLKAIK